MKFVFLIIAALCAALSGCGGNNPLSAVNAQAQAAALSKSNIKVQSLARHADESKICALCPIEIKSGIHNTQDVFDAPLTLAPAAQGGAGGYQSVNNPNHSIVNVVMTTGVQEPDNLPLDNVSVFASDIPVIYAVVSAKNSAPNTVISVRWIAVNAQDTPTDALLATSQIQVEGDVNIAFSLSRDETALWAPGAYRLQVSEDGEIDGTLDFTIRDGGASAPSSPEARVTNVITFSKTDASGKPIDTHGEFPPGTFTLGAQVFVVSTAEVEAKAVWYTGVVEGWPPDTKLFEATARATNQPNGIPFTIERTSGEAFPAGRYKLEVYLDNALANTTVFHVANAAAPSGTPLQFKYQGKLNVTPEWTAPAALVIAPNGDLYVGEAGAVRRVAQDLSSTRFGEMGFTQGDGKLGAAVTGIAADSQSNLWVANPQHSNIQKFSADGKFLLRFPGDDTNTYDKDGEVNQAYGIAIDKQDNVYVADTLNNRIQKFDINGKFLAKWTDLGLKSPIGIATDAQGNVYVTDSGNHRVVKLDSQGKLLGQFGKQGAGDGEFNGPWGIALDAAGNILVTDNFNQRVQVFDAQGKFIAKFGSKGTGEGQFGKPVSVLIAPSGNVYVADGENNTVQIFAADAASNNPPASSGATTPGQGKMIADLGFRPAQDGFSFANYGGDYPGEQGDIFVEDLIRMFGEKVVCAGYKNGECQVAPGALEFADILNASSNGGHCEGMAVLSMQMFLGQEARQTYGGSRTADLKFENQALQRAIMYYFAWQAVNPVRSARRASLASGPNQVLDDIIAGIQKRQPVIIAFFNGTGKATQGHAVTPYAVEEMGNGLYYVWIYDNNYPGQERYIEMNRATNTWRYSFAAVNPSADPDAWGGGASDQNIGVASVSLRNGQGDCFWCNYTTNTSARPMTQFALLGGGSMLVTNSQGQRLGWVDGELINEIPDAFEYSIIGGLGKPSIPIFMVPSHDQYKMALDSNVAQTTNAQLFAFGGGKSLNIDKITLAPGERNTLGLSGNLNDFRYTPESAETSLITLTVDGADQDYYFAFDGLNIDDGKTLSFAFDETKGTLAFSSDNDTANGTYNLMLKRVGNNGIEIYQNANLTFGQATEYIDYNGWDGAESLEIGVDHNDDGNVDEEWQEENER